LRLVQRIGEGEVPVEKAQAIFNPAFCRAIREALRRVVTRGTARGIADTPLAGKTGSAEVGGSNETHSWFVFLAPHNAPQVVGCVLLEYGGEGRRAARLAAQMYRLYETEFL